MSVLGRTSSTAGIIGLEVLSRCRLQAQESNRIYGLVGSANLYADQELCFANHSLQRSPNASQVGNAILYGYTCGKSDEWHKESVASLFLQALQVR